MKHFVREYGPHQNFIREIDTFNRNCTRKYFNSHEITAIVY